MTDQARKAMIEKVSKLLALAGNNPNEAEAMLAMERAQKLMEEYNISVGEMELRRGESKKTSAYTVGQSVGHHVNRSLANWEKLLFTAVAEHCNCSWYTQHGGGKRRSFVLVGDEVEVAVAKALYPLMWQTAMEGAKQHYGPRYGPDHRNYCEGFALRVYERVCRIRREATVIRQAAGTENAYALVVQDKRGAISQYMGNLGLRKARQSGGTGRMNADAHMLGAIHGNNVSLDKRGIK